MSRTTTIKVQITDLAVLEQVCPAFGARYETIKPNSWWPNRVASIAPPAMNLGSIYVHENEDKSYRFAWDEDYTHQLNDIYGVGFEHLVGAYNAQVVVNQCASNGKMFHHVGQRASVMDKLNALGGELPAGLTEADLANAQVVQIYV